MVTLFVVLDYMDGEPMAIMNTYMEAAYYGERYLDGLYVIVEAPYYPQDTTLLKSDGVSRSLGLRVCCIDNAL